MKLRYSPTSPYVRKVRVCALERGLDSRIELLPTNPTDPKSDLAKDNPLVKVPALVLDDSQVLYDSPVICEYLDSLHDGEPLIPAPGPARWTALRQQALADGILDAAILRMVETVRRPEALRWSGWVERQRAKMVQAADVLDQEVKALQGPLTLGQIAVGCALGYIDFRFAADDWRAGRPALTKWYQGFAERPSMQASVPQDPA